MENIETKSVKDMNMQELCDFCHSIAKEKGFWDEERNIGEALMLVVTELAEAMEGYRHQDHENFREEIADAYIRLFDFCGGMGIDISGEIAKKCEKNKKRPYKHGKIC